MKNFDPNAFVLSLKEKGISIEADKEGSLDIEAPKGSLNQELINSIKQYKPELIGFLEQQASSKKAIERHQQFWKEQIAKQERSPELPMAKDRLKISAKKYRNLPLALPESLLSKWDQWKERNAQQQYLELVTVLKILLYRYTQEQTVALGVSFAKQMEDFEEGKEGWPLMTTLNADDSFFNVLDKVSKDYTEMEQHISVALDPMWSLNGKAESGRHPFFDCCFLWRNKATFPHITNADLAFVGQIEKQKFTFELFYRDGLYVSNQLKRMWRHFIVLFENILATPDQAIGTLNYIDEKEQQQLLIDFNQTEVPFPTDKTLVDCFNEQAIKSPDAIALVFHEQKMTYRELNEQSNQLANYLLEVYQVQSDELIGLQLPKGFPLIVSLLGILKSGAAYVPIDPDYPQQRIDFIVKDSQCQLCIDEKGFQQFQNQKANYSKAQTKTKLAPQHLAYVIYTSGSTGKPKGVLIEHRCVVNLIAYQSAFFKVQSTDHFILFSNISFDASIEQLFLSLFNGAQLLLPTKEDLLDKKRFEQLLQVGEIHHLHAVPSFLKTISVDASTHLKRVVSGGELFDPILLKNFASSAAIYNEYGPTETTVTSIEYQVNGTEYNEKRIGRPLGNTNCYVLDDQLELLPIGHVGELYLGGAGLARAYLNRPKLTAERFVPNPFSKGTRLYRTGDLARWTKEGELEFLGRSDTQIKLRGYRIELGEIESQLKNHPTITEAVALVKENKGEKYLLAYYHSAQAHLATDLVHFLSDKLPDYMIPHHYLHLSEFPLTANGKLDRKSLQNKVVKFDRDYVAPANEAERKLTQMWSEILNIPAEEISTKSSFFNLGGHSLIANELLNKVRRQFAISFTAKELFRKNTIQLIANHIANQRQKTKSKSGLVQRLGRAINRNRRPWFDQEEMLETVKQVDSKAEHFPVYHRQKREYLQFLQYNDYDFNLIFHLQLFNTNQEALQQCIEAIFQRHESLRTTFLIADGRIRQKIHPQFPPGFQIEKQSLLETNDRDRELDGIYKKMSGRAFDFEQSLVAIKIVEVLPDVHGVIVAIHHAVSDKKSAEILKREMELLYDAYQRKNTPDLPSVPLQLKAYAYWVNAFLKSKKGRRSKQFYKMAIMKSLAVNGEHATTDPTAYREQVKKELRADFETLGLTYNEAFGTLAKLHSAPGASWSVFLDRTKLQQLRDLAAYCDSSLFMLLIASFALLVHLQHKVDSVRLCLPYSTRIFEAFENLTGWLSSEILACLEIEPTLSFKDWVAKVTKRVLETADHRLYPHEQILDDLSLPLDVLVPYFLNLLKTEENFTGTIEKNHQQDRSGYFGLNCTMHEFNNGLSIELQYNCQQYTSASIETMMSTYLALLEHLSVEPNQSLAMLGKEDESIASLPKV